MWHVAPQSARESIRTYGLNELMGTDWRANDQEFADAPRGQYLFADLADAEQWAGEHSDIWAVDVDEAQCGRDPHLPGAFYHVRPISASRLQLERLGRPRLSDGAAPERIAASELSRLIDHWEPTGNHRAGIPAQAELERRRIDLAMIYCPPAQREQWSQGGDWWDPVSLQFHGSYRNDDPHYHRKLEAQLRKDPSALPPIVLVETSPGRYEIEDGWHRCSIARHVGVRELDACIYTLDLQQEQRQRHELQRPQLG
jgi:hypothetical protein